MTVTRRAATASYTDVERARAAAWKRSTRTLDDAARQPGRYVNKDGVEIGAPGQFCLPPDHAVKSLLPEVRSMSLALFRELGIPWHAGVGDGPSNHLLSSQVQCVNALGQMVHDPERIQRAFGECLDTEEVLQVEPGRYLTFEYIGPHDYFHEGFAGERTRGAYCTSVDAAFLHRVRSGVTELVLIEWKYTESYGPRTPDAVQDAKRSLRYASAYAAEDGPVRAELLAFENILDEPLYQLTRQQLLAHHLEKDHVLGADRVKVLHVSPAPNRAYQESIFGNPLSIGATVSEVWKRLLRRPDRFQSIDSAVFLDPDVTSPEYLWRYGDILALDMPELLRLCNADVEDFLYVHVDFDGDVAVSETGVELIVSGISTELSYPFSMLELYDLARELESEEEDSVR